jgi:hypothetical protein
MNIFKLIKSLLIAFCIPFILTACTKPDWSKPIEPNGMKRAAANAREGKGIQLFKSNKSNNFMFASSNPMWRASLDTLDFISLANVDYSGGIIITDWYSEENSNEAIKISIRFLSNEIRADGLIINLHKKTCKNNNCTVKPLKNDLIFDIRDKILKTAVLYKVEDDAKGKKKSRAILSSD